MSVRRLDIHHNIDIRTVLAPQTVSSSTTTAGAIIDTKGFYALEFTLAIGTRTDGTYGFIVEESDNSDMSSSNEVLDEDLLGTEATMTTAATGGRARIGYRIGNKRYVRASIVSTGVTSGATLVRADAILATAQNSPTITP